MPTTSLLTKFRAPGQEQIWAVIAAAPEDRAWTEWLYFTLHGYPVPAGITAQATRHGFPLPETLTVFPDPNDPDHTERYGAALQNGCYLIAVVSPQSAHSKVLDEHIRAFKRSGSEERVIVLVVEGDPDAAMPAGKRPPIPEWLPPWLKWRVGPHGFTEPVEASEPIVVDARPGCGSLDEVMLSLLAGILDLRREELEILDAINAAGLEGSPVELHKVRVPKALAVEGNPEPATNVPLTEETTAKVPVSQAATPIPGEPAGAGLAPAVSIAAPEVAESSSVGGARIGLMAAFATIVAGLAIWSIVRPEMTGNASLLMPRSNEIVAAGPERIGPQEGAVEMAPEPPPAFPQIELMTGQTEGLAPVATLDDPAASAADLPAVEQLWAAPAPSRMHQDVSAQVESALLREKKTLAQQAVELLQSGTMAESLQAHVRALDSAQQYAERRPSDPHAQADVAVLCRSVGTLQLALGSATEARATLERGRSVLAGLKAKGQLPSGREKILVGIEEVLRRPGQE